MIGIKNNWYIPKWIGKDIPGVYVVQNRQTGRIYVGSSENIRRRLIGHFSKLRHGRHPNSNLQADFNRYGFSGFISRILVRCNPEELAIKEQHFLNVDSQMYNIIKFADGSILPEETKRKISESLRGNKNCVGRKLSRETREKISLAKKGRKMSDETRQRMAAAKRGRPSNNQGQ